MPLNNLKVYPSPSSGYLWVENNSQTSIVVILKTITGTVISKFILDANKKIELNSLKQGMILVESWNEVTNDIVNRQLVPVIFSK